jgi:DEAD/DEAH box helicase domain-containing protein
MADLSASQLEQSIEECGFGIHDKCILPLKEPTYEGIPTNLDPKIRLLLEERFPKGLYKHQSQAIREALAGNDLCIATSTASGKSLVFITAALEILLRDPMAKILAFYPVRALIQDQLEKWRTILDPLHINLGFIDGSVDVGLRLNILARSRVVLMTPDVAHAWLLKNIGHRYVDLFLRRVRLLIMDEAHVYDGVFGTNMAYFLRRFQAFSPNHQVICCTATIGEPSDFMEKLVGRTMRVFDIEADTSARPQKTILLCRRSQGNSFQNTVELLKSITKLSDARFLAFGDSRKMVERIVAATYRQQNATQDQAQPGENAEDEDDLLENDLPTLPSILPYRAGYEAEDRHEIQNALSHGELSGVVATSALELGLDIGEIKVVLLLNSPPSVKSLLQRLGRAGRRSPAVCIVLDDQENIESLQSYLSRQMEASWLYLDNRYIQYANALCAAYELSAAGLSEIPHSHFQSLPPGFFKFLENELNPSEIVPSDLYTLKQRAAAGNPHWEFPIRSQMEQEFRVSTFQGTPRGNLSFSQALREAYPGAIYYYMARAYRVRRFNYRSGEIKVTRERQWTTRPHARSMVFPKFRGGTFSLYRSDSGFFSEVELQVSERVTGFEEMRGPNRTTHVYGPGSEFYPSPINRFFLTTGVCWYFTSPSLITEAMASALSHAFCDLCGVQERDLGIGRFHSRENPLSPSPCQGMSIYDSTNGSLRLTQRLAEKLPEIVEWALITQTRAGNVDLAQDIKALKQMVAALQPSETTSEEPVEAGGDYVITIGLGQPAMYRHEDGCQEVEVIGHRYTPKGLMLQLRSQDPMTNWMVMATHIEPIHGMTEMIRLNLVSGETEPLGSEITDHDESLTI